MYGKEIRKRKHFLSQTYLTVRQKTETNKWRLTFNSVTPITIQNEEMALVKSLFLKVYFKIFKLPNDFWYRTSTDISQKLHILQGRLAVCLRSYT